MSFQLYIMRHAKSDWSSPGLNDFDRPINKRGKKNAKRIGQWMHDHQHAPDKIIASPALRARQTAELVIDEIKPLMAAKIYYDADLYSADTETLLEAIQLYKSGLNSLMLIAHNPGLEYLLNHLIEQADQYNRQSKSVTTANLIILEYADERFDPHYDKGRLIEFIKPKELD